MPQFSANLTMLFTEVQFLERFRLAAEAGFSAVEFMFPYEHQEAEVADALRTHNLNVVLHNLPAGDWSAGERGIACHPGRVDEFRAGVALAIRYALALGTPRLNCLAGIPPAGTTVDAARMVLIDNLRYAATEAGTAGIDLLLEPVNTRDIPGFFVSTSSQAMQIIREVGASNLKLQYDVYHAQVMEGDLANTIERLLPDIGHVQVADNPGRHEPGTGEINYPYLFSRLDQLGYAGWVGCEYRPHSSTLAGLGWIEATRSIGN